MRNILIILFLLLSYVSFGQPGYTLINHRYNWKTGAFTELTIPASSTHALATGQWRRAGAVMVDTSGADSGFYYMGENQVWHRLVKESESTTFGRRFGVTSEDNTAAQNRTYSSSGIHDFTFSTLDDFTVTNDNRLTLTTTKGNTIGQIDINAFGADMTLQYSSLGLDSSGFLILNEYSAGLGASDAGAGASGLVDVFPTYINFAQSEGVYKFENLQTRTDTSVWKPIVFRHEDSTIAKLQYWPGAGAAEGLQETLDAGSTLTSPETIATGAHGLTITATGSTTALTANSSSGYGGYFWSSSGSGAKVEGSSVGLEVQGGTAITALGTGASPKAIAMQITPATTNTSDEIEQIIRESSGTATAGIGVHRSYRIENGSNSLVEAGTLGMTLTAVTASSETGRFNVALRNAGAATAEKFVIEGDGRIYGTGLHNSAGAITGTTNQYIASGTNTPTATSVTNITSSTPGQTQYMRVGNVVTVSGVVEIDCASASISSQLDLSLPIASNFTTANQLSGVLLAAETGVASPGHGTLQSDATNDRVIIVFTPRVDTAVSYRFTYTYEIL